MCRHAAYVGPAIPLTYLLWDGAHSLRFQARNPRELLLGTTCADGFGVAWYQTERSEAAARYANPLPLWSDNNVPGFGAVVASEMQIAAVRDATVQGTNTEANCHPFTDGAHSFSHNGYLEDFQGSWKEHVLEWISPERRHRIRGSTDSEHLFQAILTEADQLSGRESLVLAVQTLLRRTLELAYQLQKKCQLNVLIANGQVCIATREGNQPAANSLYVLLDGGETPGGIVVASEPLHEGDWQAVPEGQLLVAQTGAPLVRMNV